MRVKYIAGVLAVLATTGITQARAETNDAAELAAPDVRGVQRKVAPNEVAFNGKTLFVVPTGTGRLSAAERAAIIRDRLEEVAAHYAGGPDAVSVTQTGSDTFVVAVAGDPVATVEPRLARTSGAPNAEALAEIWAESLRHALPSIPATSRVARVTSLRGSAQ